MTWVHTDEDRQVVTTMLQQIGRMNVLAISGGRSSSDLDAEGRITLTLPVGNGYKVEVTYDSGWDTYIVSRVFIRAGKRFVKGTVEQVYCDQVGEVAYRASCYRNGEFGS